jgi:hypothetical protein
MNKPERIIYTKLKIDTSKEWKKFLKIINYYYYKTWTATSLNHKKN